MANSNCLGLYIEENLIKYAKVSKDRDNIKVEAFGIKFYDKIGEAIQQVIQETYSQKTPISINMSEEMYNYFDMFAMLTKNDLQKAVKTEFEAYCTEKGYNPNVFETRYAVVGNQEDKDKIKIIHVAENKIELNKQIQLVEGYKVSNISPISMAITNLINTQGNDNALIVNIEDITTITTILDNNIYKIDKIEEGSRDFLTKINLKENSYLNSYEICKNTTIYTSEGKELQEEQSEYLQDIMPTLYSIVGKVRSIIREHVDKIRKVYITGTAALINNVDLYFQEYLENVDCEILRPYFVQTTGDISIKDYIEVNSAISLGLMGIGEGITGMNFKNLTFSDRIPSWLKIEMKSEKDQKNEKTGKDKKLLVSNWITLDLGQPLDNTEKNLVRISVGLLLLVTIYSIFSGILAYQMNLKHQKADESISNTNAQIKIANDDTTSLQDIEKKYENLIKELQVARDELNNINEARNSIPNLLNQIMSVIPNNVQLISIQNTTDKHIVIEAKSNKYEQLGFFTAKIRTDLILDQVSSSEIMRSDNIVTIKIEGELP